jgi:hypothetical protein
VTASDYLSIAALVISVASVSFSIYFGVRDRSRLKAKSQFYTAWEQSEARMVVRAVNRGRRPIILTMLGGYYEDGSWQGTHLGEHPVGLRLAENERFEETIGSEHHILYNIHESRITDLWFEDTLGRRYKVKGAKKHLKLL